MQLLEIRKKLTLAEKGHKLLEEKRDALVEQFFRIIDERNSSKEQLDRIFVTAFASLIQAQMIMGEHQVQQASMLSKIEGTITFHTENIMGVSIPGMNTEDFKLPEEPVYSFTETCAKLDDSKQAFTDAMKQLLVLADLEGRIKSLAVEIEKTKRRVNVLENTLIPKLISTIKYIEMKLEEREREDFFRRKRIKALMEKQRR
jgi:V/A-type H+-transporting ATPase subunit D